MGTSQDEYDRMKRGNHATHSYMRILNMIKQLLDDGLSRVESLPRLIDKNGVLDFLRQYFRV